MIGLLLAFAGAVAQAPAPSEADEILAQLSKISLDKKQIHSIRDVTIRRDALSISFGRGIIAFLEPVMGKVTGAVFIGSGELVAIPPDAIERQQIYKYTGSPVLNEPFRAALFRFTDDSFEEITREIARHAHEDVAEEDAAALVSWQDAVLRSGRLNFRILTDLLESGKQPLFSGEFDGDQTGFFTAVFDPRASEEVAVHGGTDVWLSFDQRSESRNREAVAHEKKLPFDVLAYEIDAALSVDSRTDFKTKARLKAAVDGLRVLNFRLSSSLRLASVALVNGDVVPFVQHSGESAFLAVLPRPLTMGEEETLLFVYGGEAGDRRSWYPASGMDDRALFEMTFHYPAAMPVLASGRKIKEWQESDILHSSWTSEGELLNAGFTAGGQSFQGSEAPLAYLTGILGSYPYGSLNLLQSSQTVANNWPALIELPVENPAGERTLALEIARQWFGHKITAASYHDEWLFEALRRYLSAMYIESKNGNIPFREILNEARAAALENDGAGPIWLGRRLTSTVSPEGQLAVSHKGTWVLHMLRMMMRQNGADPDRTFTSMLRELAETYSGKPVSTWDFRRLAEKHAAADLEWFFDQWVFASGIPAYNLSYQVESAAGSFEVEGTITQTGAPDGFTMPLPVYADGELLGRVTVSGETEEFRFPAAKKPERVLIDPFETVLRKPGL